MNKIKGLLLLLTFVVVALAAMPGYADQGDWLVRVGAHSINPKSDNHSVVEVESATMATFNFTYFIRDAWAVEVLAALPFEHDIELVGGGRVASTKHLPPTVSYCHATRVFALGHPLQSLLWSGSLLPGNRFGKLPQSSQRRW